MTGDKDKLLFSELVRALVNESLWPVVSPSRGGNHAKVDHYFMNPFESAARFLSSQGCAKLESPFAFVLNPDKAASIVSKSQNFERLQLDVALYTFLTMSVHHGLPHLRHGVFVMESPFASLFKALATCGFGESGGREFVWSRKIAPYMWSVGAWPVTLPGEAFYVAEAMHSLAINRPKEFDEFLAERLRPDNPGAYKYCLFRFVFCGRWLQPSEDTEILPNQSYDPAMTVLAYFVRRREALPALLGKAWADPVSLIQEALTG